MAYGSIFSSGILAGGRFLMSSGSRTGESLLLSISIATTFTIKIQIGQSSRSCSVLTKQTIERHCVSRRRRSGYARLSSRFKFDSNFFMSNTWKQRFLLDATWDEEFKIFCLPSWLFQVPNSNLAILEFHFLLQFLPQHFPFLSQKRCFLNTVVLEYFRFHPFLAWFPRN